MVGLIQGDFWQRICTGEDFGGESDSDRVVGQGEIVDPTQDAPAPA